MGKLTVQLPNAQYDVHVGDHVYELFSSDFRELLNTADRIGIIADDVVATNHLPVLLEALENAGVSPSVKIVPAGEKCKTSMVYIECQSFLLQENFTRNSLVIAFGGGACGDLAGFVAATFMRGIRFIQCPTTILAHDSAVGGKTAINLPEGKNMVGSFHQPSAVLFNTALLKTLPSREVRSGMAELIKHAFITDANWANQLMEERNFSNPSIEWLSTELLKGIQVKADIVAADEFEHSIRKYLNFGHTFGHAVEAVCGFGGLSHGESVIIGMAYSFILSEKYGNIDSSFTNHFIDFAKKNGYSFEPVLNHSFNEFLFYMKKDKKATFGEMNFIVLKEVGIPFVQKVTEIECKRVFNELQLRLD
ncbi:3-dehydroquinate synthase [Sporosarcina thermotolerans]|uniref:3-dehydroquinate synthase n=1 Tax=Sporosarcina thermotolerans TaxID=633404 RepID=A0AAW9A8Q4_9BACL|nr:3-dehydroquinate synthase [Sporosarcina thermotolerans]MDW0115556.1 3-dehydroquinate synthase [Sporosarcina thermotolerans]WHT47140.1 3-dehydroquinate synthase [Sporosarcina thermotolerans]